MEVQKGRQPQPPEQKFEQVISNLCVCVWRGEGGEGVNIESELSSVRCKGSPSYAAKFCTPPNFCSTVNTGKLLESNLNLQYTSLDCSLHSIASAVVWCHNLVLTETRLQPLTVAGFHSLWMTNGFSCQCCRCSLAIHSAPRFYQIHVQNLDSR